MDSSQRVRAFTIHFPSGSSNTRRPANIPLHNLARRLYDDDDDDDEHDEKGDRSRLARRSGSASASASFDEDELDDDDFSLWSDTGDLVDQLEEDPLAARLNPSLDRGRPRQSKRVRYANEKQQQNQRDSGVVKRKEDISVPSPPSRPLNWGQRLLVKTMAPNDSASRMHGLHGKKLIYFLSIFVSLGVFLFGYDQGVMSGMHTK